MPKPRGRDLGLPFPGETGRYNAITDVPGVEVGFATRIEGEGPLVMGRGPVRTGVTAILPLGRQPEPEPVWAGMYALNGNGEMTGTHWIRDGGYLVGPVCITNTHSVGIVHHAATRWMIRTYAEAWQSEHLWAMPVVAETYDGVLNDINGQHVTEADALAALDNASSGAVAEGNVGGGTGMICYEFKGGTGTASRRLEIDGTAFHVGALVQANHGIRPWFTVLRPPAWPAHGGGSPVRWRAGFGHFDPRHRPSHGTAPAHAAGEARGDRNWTRRDAGAAITRAISSWRSARRTAVRSLSLPPCGATSS